MKDKLPKLQRYLRRVFRSDSLRVVMAPKKADMAEVYVGEEFIGTITEDEDDASDFQLQMAILGDDLEGP